MGYLNSDTVTVDAILTKHGRKLLANGASLQISQFALADDGIDYSLYNVDHPSGSNSYGDAITSLPMIEAVPDDSVIMRYRLNNLPRDTEYLPYLTGIRDIELPEISSEDTITPGTSNWNTLYESHYQFLVTDITNINITPGGAGAGTVDYSYPQTPGTTDFGQPYAQMYTGTTIAFSPSTSISADKTVQVTVYGVDSGATDSFSVTIKANN